MLKLCAGYICGEHKALAQQYGATAAQVIATERILELARAYTLGNEAEKRRLGAVSADRVFIVHGRDVLAKTQLENLLRRCGLTPVAIMNEPVRGRTIIEQIHEHSDVGYAVVIITPDDEGRLRDVGDLTPRGRQNVIFEYGLFVGKLGRERVCCLARTADLEMPSDLAGVLEIRYDNDVNEAALRLVDELRAAGYPAHL
jgi:predicted nucleotide-binding protein